MIVVTAATGNIGSKVLNNLLAGDEEIRVIARNLSKLPIDSIRQIEVIEGSHGDHDVVMRAFEGADSVFWLVSSDPTAISAEASYVDFSRPACEALRYHGVKHVVGISSIGRGWPRDAGYITATLKLDDLIAETGVAYRALAVGSLMENVLRQTELIRDQGIFCSPAPVDSKVPAVASRDVAAVAVQLLLDQSWTGVESIPLMGPGDITYGEMVQTMSNVLGKPIGYRAMGIEDMKTRMIENGTSEGMVQAMVNMLTAQNEGLGNMNSRPTPNNSHTTFAQWCETVLKPAVQA